MSSITHSDLLLTADASKVVIRPFDIAVEPRDSNPVQLFRAKRIVHAVLAMPERSVATELALVLEDFADRHTETRAFFEARCEDIMSLLRLNDEVSPARRHLIGAYFSLEYAYAAAAIMNPSVVIHPDQKGVKRGHTRIVLSLRTVGEGHISSIAFREAELGPGTEITLCDVPNSSIAAKAELDGDTVFMSVSPDTPLSATVLFPATAAQRNGLEDLRMTRFSDEGAKAVFYGTFTAFSGQSISSQLLETKDFQSFSLRPLRGSASHNKGMALFPRKIDGQYAMIGRQDNESLYFLSSPQIDLWDDGILIAAPVQPWELVQIGNCGPPIEIDEGWLLLTHGVGAVRQYAIGAMLLDRDDPTKVLGRTAQPIISPVDDTRNGYVPNVVYTCGALALGRRLFIPYAVSDSAVTFGWFSIDDLMDDMKEY
ncbi:glycoside hydrolase family 130 protein [Hyphomonas sp.]|uniref:glycoside hydrolase family 130 protein n=1 Tax=Hyphomonas sp. TaxID=87 RepID=UPI0039198510